MGVERVIDGVHIVPMGMANAYLIEGDDGLTLIDAGFPNKEGAVFEAIRGLGRSPEQLRNLIFTHGHPDHIGSATAIVRETGARTYMHPLDIPMAESGGPFRPMTPAPGLLRQVMCRLFFHPDERVEPVGIDQPLSPGEILSIARASTNWPVFHSTLLGLATASLSPAMRRASSGTSGAINHVARQRRRKSRPRDLEGLQVRSADRSCMRRPPR
jgi:glyoxylase-like metal-dependent hydrolase (beta-lactamase superfamily II)